MSFDQSASTVNEALQLIFSPYVTGIIGAVAKDFFNSTITMEIVNQAEEVERTRKREHVVFLVTQTESSPERRGANNAMSPTTLCPATTLTHDAPLMGKEVKCV